MAPKKRAARSLTALNEPCETVDVLPRGSLGEPPVGCSWISLRCKAFHGSHGPEAQRGEVWSAQPSHGLGDMAQRVGSRISVVSCVRRRAHAERIADDEQDPVDSARGDSRRVLALSHRRQPPLRE